MYLSKLTLNLRSHRARRDLSNAYEMHRTLLWEVTEAEASHNERLLWRLEPGRRGMPVLLVQTHARPQWDVVLERNPDYADVASDSPKFYAPSLWVDQRVRFRLKANVSVKREGKRHALHMPEQKMAWLSRQAETHGFALDGVMIVATERLRARKNSHQISLDATVFEGAMRVVDPNQASNALSHGIGHAKAFGLGLMSIAPIGDE